MYGNLTLTNQGSYSRHIWKRKIPPKIKMFMWLLKNGVLLTKDDLKREIGEVMVVVVFAPRMSTLIIFSFHAPSPKSSGVMWPVVSIRGISPLIWIIVGHG